MKSLVACLALPMVFLAAPATVGAQDHGGGCGDVFGDLIEIKRDAVTGQPILQERWIEYPMDIFDWGYCPIPIDADGNEIPFVDLSCDAVDVDAVVKVDYFGRLNGGRTKERNNRMHFNEVIENIKMADRVRQDSTGRLELGFDCELNTQGQPISCDYATVDSPMESMGLYVRLMKYGHIQTDPLEVDTSAHGDPALPTQYHPALAPEDYAKFDHSVRHLLPGEGQADCFPGGVFDLTCADREPLNFRDLVRSGSFMAGAADKTGKVTTDLVQYFNRIMKITKDTEHTLATLNTLPALIRLEDGVTIVEAAPGLPAPADERFVDFGATVYKPHSWRNWTLEVITPLNRATYWVEEYDVPQFSWLKFRNGRTENDEITDIDGYIAAASDSLRSIEFVHNYAIPVDLGWDFKY